MDKEIRPAINSPCTNPVMNKNCIFRISGNNGS